MCVENEQETLRQNVRTPSSCVIYRSDYVVSLHSVFDPEIDKKS